ncbi:MAG TPA: amidohydrolase family protein [Sphingomicrobium sp.]|nr:amidohydrolase family protein [Sphingomicrobium sp.]
MHLHAEPLAAFGSSRMPMCTPFPEMPTWDQREPFGAVLARRRVNPPCENPVWSPTTDAAVMQDTIAAMKRHNVYGVLSGSAERVAAWRRAAPGRFWSGLSFTMSRGLSVQRLADLRRNGQLDVLAEVMTQYEGIAPTDPRLEPYWALAERLDIPVGIHVGTGPFGVIYLDSPGYRGRMHSALTMEEVLVKHPRLRVYLAHAGYPMIDDLLTLMYAHPQVHIDTGVIVYTQPRAAFYRYLERIVEAGFGKRIMFGSDQMVWPGVIERSIRVIEEAPFLTQEQKRDILYNNAARFLRLTPEQIAKHHGR